MPGHLRTYRPWSEGEIEFLRDNRELTHAEASEELIDRTPGAVYRARKALGYTYIGKKHSVIRERYGQLIRDSRPPDVEYLPGAGSPCLRCWNRLGSKNRYGCLKCTERLKYDEDTSRKGVLLTFQCDYGLHINTKYYGRRSY